MTEKRIDPAPGTATDQPVKRKVQTKRLVIWGILSAKQAANLSRDFKSIGVVIAFTPTFYTILKFCWTMHPLPPQRVGPSPIDRIAMALGLTLSENIRRWWDLPCVESRVCCVLSLERKSKNLLIPWTVFGYFCWGNECGWWHSSS